MILVTGGTGVVGSALLEHLARSGEQVRVLTHSTAGRDTVQRHGFEVAAGDLDDSATVASAMRGCDRLFLLSPADPAQPVRERAAIDVALRAGVGRIVSQSVDGADHSSPLAFKRWHAEIDDHLIAAKVPYAILRPAGFMETHLWPVDMVTTQGRWYGMTGQGEAAYVAADDIARVAAVALTRADHFDAVHEITGPAAITMAQAATELSEVIGREVPYVDLPAEQFKASLDQAGVPDWLAATIVTLYAEIRDGQGAAVTGTVQEITGRPARTYREFAQTRRADFRR